MVRRGLALACWLCACSVVDGETHTFSDEGGLCLRSADDGRLHVTVTFRTCLSSSCERALEASCSVTVTDGQIVIRSRGSYEFTGARECTADCGSLLASCESQPLEPGDYTVVHGSDSASVTLPQTELRLFDDGRAACPL